MKLPFEQEVCVIRDINMLYAGGEPYIAPQGGLLPATPFRSLGGDPLRYAALIDAEGCCIAIIPDVVAFVNPEVRLPEWFADHLNALEEWSDE
jgi:hypothetical protein